MATFYAPEFRSESIRECESLRDYLHGNQHFQAYATPEEAVTAARSQLEDDANGRDQDEGPVTIEKWSRQDDYGHVFQDGGVWYELSDSEEGRVVIHQITTP